MPAKQRSTVYPLFCIPVLKVFLMTFISFGVYPFVWTFKQWRAAKTAVAGYSSINLILRSLFLDIFLFPQTALIKKETGASFLIFLAPVINLALSILSFIFLYKISFLSLFLSNFVIAVLFAWLQYKINKAAPAKIKAEGDFRGSDFASIIIGGILFILSASNLFFLEEYPAVKCKPYTAIEGDLVYNQCLGFQLTAPKGARLKISGSIGEPFTVFSSNPGEIGYYFEVKGTNNKMKDFDSLSSAEVAAYKTALLKRNKKSDIKKVSAEVVQVNGKMMAKYMVELADGWRSAQYIVVHNGTTFNIMLNAYNADKADLIDAVADSIVLS